jgi:hypothetical protein
MKFSILATLSLFCLSSACENHDHHSHSHEHEEDSTTSSAHRRLGQPDNVFNFSQPSDAHIPFWVGKWPSFQDFKASGARCGQPKPTVREEKESAEMFAVWKAKNRGKIRRLFNSYEINTYVHVICDSNGNGCATQNMTTAQMSVLNAAFANSSFSFKLAGQTQTNNSNWYTVASKEVLRI